MSYFDGWIIGYKYRLAIFYVCKIVTMKIKSSRIFLSPVLLIIRHTLYVTMGEIKLKEMLLITNLMTAGDRLRLLLRRI